jgi:hypothetical protein
MSVDFIKLEDQWYNYLDDVDETNSNFNQFYEKIMLNLLTK